ncbi:glycosyltransferase family 2 protein [Geminocystis sp. NIES-3709]|uniref:glycosyltransferase family 2 protein n=1 Tax=Geminocystis sp. NIES-3709 TaxID=1617448 RepID=UPI0005FC3E45|nr:glycosyltransferase [Geminocystis sp. NIES-3709]BAQ66471.1 glycosyl transferase [Geminocystis sp. NIES-3709]
MNYQKFIYTLSIIIPVYNGGESFYHCLLSVKKFAPPDTEIIIVADGDTDGSRKLAQEFTSKIIINDRPLGPANARNLGAKIAKGDLLFFLDADVSINEQTIPNIQQFFATNPNKIALIGSYDDQPGANNFLSQYKNLFHHYTHQQGKENASTFWGACGVIKRDIFEKIGGFNESYKLPSVEDIELGYRLINAGYKINLVKDIQVKHLKKWGVITLLKADIFQRAIPWTILLLKYGNVVNDLNLNWTNRVSILLLYSFLILTLFLLKLKFIYLILLIIIIILLIVNRKFYDFLYTKKGLFFTLKAIFWHWFYYLYGGFGFGLGVILFRFKNVN